MGAAHHPQPSPAARQAGKARRGAHTARKHRLDATTDEALSDVYSALIDHLISHTALSGSEPLIWASNDYGLGGSP